MISLYFCMNLNMEGVNEDENNYDELYENAVSDLISKIYTRKNRLTLKQACALKSMRDLIEEDQKDIYDYYIEEYNKRFNVNVSDGGRRKYNTFSNRLNDLIAANPNDLYSFDDFKEITKDWNKGKNKSIERWYDEYNDRLLKIPGKPIRYEETPLTGLIGFKGRDKVNAIKLNLYPTGGLNSAEYTRQYFPLKSNKKKYQLHKVASRNTWMIDLMICSKLTYLVMINVNTKYLCVELTNIELGSTGTVSRTGKSTLCYLRALKKIIDKGIKVRYLCGDGEGAFTSKLVKKKKSKDFVEGTSDENDIISGSEPLENTANDFYDKHGIQFISVPRQMKGVYPEFMKKEQRAASKTQPLHSSLGIIDRVIRSIRDMAYNMKVGVITPIVMNEIVRQYNYSPHKGLSKWAGFSVSPKMVNDDPDLEEYIVRKICQANWEIMNSPGFRINDGVEVKVYNDVDKMMKRRTILQPGKHKVNGFKNGLYEIVNENGQKQMMPRYRLAFMYE